MIERGRGSKGKKAIISLIILFFISPCLFAHHPNSVTTQKKKLASLKASIASLQHTLVLSQSQKEAVQAALQSTEQNIGETAKKLQVTLKQLQLQQKHLSTTQAQHARYQAELNEQENLLEEHIRAAYLLGRQQYLKMLLNEENITQVNRDIHYYHYVTQARLQTMQSIQVSLGLLAQTTAKILTQTQSLQATRQEQQEENDRLLQAKQSRHQLLTALNASIQSKEQQLQKLQQDKDNLEKIIQAINQKPFTGLAPGGAFVSNQGRLPWPVSPGRILQNFNQPLAESNIKSTGILIAGATGSPVHAVFAGKVVFAHWLRGFGLLIIIQHGSNYMSLYGHAESVYVKPGESVKPGQVIATVGNSGGIDQSALYFEIRHLDQALNPMSWLHR